MSVFYVLCVIESDYNRLTKLVTRDEKQREIARKSQEEKKGRPCTKSIFPICLDNISKLELPKDTEILQLIRDVKKLQTEK